MYKQSSTIARLVLAAAVIVSTALPVAAQNKMLPMEPIHEIGASVQPSYEGWWKNADGSYSVLLGYFNRNSQEEPDIPVGANNHIDPGGPDYGQPTHFLPRRHWGVFALQLPKDFPVDKKLIWTIVANGQTMSVPLGINPLWNITPLSEIGIGNTPPTVSFDDKGAQPSFGPHGTTVARTAKVGEAMPITIWASDDDKSIRRPPPSPGSPRAAATAAAPPPAAEPTPDQIAAIAAAAGVDAATAAEFLSSRSVGVTFEKYRGPGEIKFAAAKPKVEKLPNGTIPKKDAFNGKVSTTATFSEPGEYIIRADVIDSSGEGGSGFLCCWTNSYLKVTVTK
jgi:hypothetical protein